MSNQSGSAGCLVSIAVLGVIGWSLTPSKWIDPLWYATRYNISTDQVHRSNKPTDCDWGRAPLGEKGCHYEKTVAAYNAQGWLLDGDGAPLFSHEAKTGKPIVSYDGGKTWDWPAVDANGNPVSVDLRVKTVEVAWRKIVE